MQDDSLQRLFEFLRFQSISADPAYREEVAACAEWLRTKLADLGLETKVHPTEGHPIVVARTPYDAARKTVLMYGHYDVQPVDPLDLWNTAPFEPTVKDGLIYARGATDNKGQIWSHIEGLRSLLEAGNTPPVNLIFVNAKDLACDVVAISDNAMLGPGVPTLTYGLRGIAALDVKVIGPRQDLHSGAFGGAIYNPIRALAGMIASMHDASGRVAIEGFYDSVVPLQPWERSMWQSIPVDPQTLLRVAGAPEWGNEVGYTPYECVWGRPTAEANGIGGGYQGPGSKTVLPSEAFAKFTFRLVPDQDPETILELVENHLRKHAPPSVEVQFTRGHGALPYVVDPHGPYGKAGQTALQKTFGGKPPVLVREGGTIPILQTFKDALGVDVLLLGLALPDCNMHAPNETFPVEHLHLGAQLHQKLLEAIAGTGADAQLP
jgi:acetylornithine deacetylase/succinyl-diaminopimelate desuccinylase-like protein